MKNYLLAFLLALLIVLSAVTLRRGLAGIGVSPIPWPPNAVGIGVSPIPWPPNAVGIGVSPIPWPPNAVPSR
jgi:hypothetical protein